MKILVLGGSGHIGRRLIGALQATPWARPVSASRGPVQAFGAGVESIQVNTLDTATLATALKGFDAVVNCVAGDGRSISDGARTLVESALSADCHRIVHLSTMSVYGPAEGNVREDTALDPSLGWYGRAKCEAEAHFGEFVRRGGEAVVLRPGCVFGPGSDLWVARIGRLLQSGRLGDLGVRGDGWSNLVHVDDVCQAVVAALQLPVEPGRMPAFNLAAPDSPRWNDYLVDLALAIRATPVRRIGRRQLQLDTMILSLPLYLARRALKNMGKLRAMLPDPIPPGLPDLWAQHIHLDATLATQQLGLVWTDYANSLRSSADWLLGADAQPALANGKVIWPP